jgi:hypothetical protein
MIKNLLLAGACLLALSGMASASTLDDPLHGYVIVNGTPTNTDNGTVSPDTGLDFGFFASPAPQTGNLLLVTLTPFAAGPVSSIGVTGTLTGTESLFSTTAFTTDQQDLGAYLGLTSNSPPNKCCTTWGGTGGYFVDTHLFTGVTLQDLASSTLDLQEGSGNLPTGSLILAFLIEKDSNGVVTTVDTANSGVLAGTFAAETPIPGAIWLFGTGLMGLAMGGVRYKSKKKIPMTKVVAV